MKSISKKLGAAECRFASDEFLSGVLNVVKGSVREHPHSDPPPLPSILLLLPSTWLRVDAFPAEECCGHLGGSS